MLVLTSVLSPVIRRTALGDQMAAGIHAGAAKRAVNRWGTRTKLGQLATVIDRLYYEDVSPEQIAEGLYGGLLRSLGDPYSAYYTPEQFKELSESTNGSYCGVGIVLNPAEDTSEVTVFHVYPNTPAAEAGVEEGDVIQSIDGVSVIGEKASQVSEQMRGEAGSAVKIGVLRHSKADITGETLEFTMERREIEVPTVAYQMLKGKIGFLQISEFTELTSEQFRQAIEALNQEQMKALIIDLRDNPGGVLDGVCEVLDQVLPEGLIVYTEDKYGKRQEYHSSADNSLGLPLAVLINGKSASAAEIFAGAVKDYAYGTLIGTKTFGKGIVQQIVSLRDGSAVKVTTSRYFTPKGNYIHGIGIEPDVELELEYLGDEEKVYDPMLDNQVKEALRILKDERSQK